MPSNWPFSTAPPYSQMGTSCHTPWPLSTVPSPNTLLGPGPTVCLRTQSTPCPSVNDLIQQPTVDTQGWC